MFTEQVTELFDELEHSPDDRPWLAVASFVNPHDIDLWGQPWDTVSYTHLTLPTKEDECRSRGSRCH